MNTSPSSGPGPASGYDPGDEAATSRQNAAAQPIGFSASLRESGLSPRAQTGRVLAAGAAILIPVLLLLPYASASSVFGGGDSATGWQLLDGTDILLLLASIGVVVLLSIDVFVAPSGRVVAAAAALSLISVGLAWPDLLGIPVGWDAGAYLVLVTAVVSAGGAVLALSEPPATRAAASPFATRAPEASTGPAQPPGGYVASEDVEAHREDVESRPAKSAAERRAAPDERTAT